MRSDLLENIQEGGFAMPDPDFCVGLLRDRGVRVQQVSRFSACEVIGGILAAGHISDHRTRADFFISLQVQIHVVSVRRQS